MSEWIAVGLSYLFVAGVLLIGMGLFQLRLVSQETTRKLIHIGVIHWWLIAVMFIQTPWIALIGPVSFIGINALNVKYKLIPGIQREAAADFGTVYYAISLSIITFISFQYNWLSAGSIALFVMGYGDGLAALIGKKIPLVQLRPGKSLGGTLTMLIVSTLVSFVFFSSPAVALLVGFMASGLELFSPKGLDNITVPLGVFLLLGVIL